MAKSIAEIKKELFDPFQWNEVTTPYRESGQVTVQKGCNSITYTNLGDVIAQVNGKTLFPSATPATVAGDSISLGGNLGEVYKGDINLKFVLPTAGTNPLVEIIQKFYTLYEIE